MLCAEIETGVMGGCTFLDCFGCAHRAFMFLDYDKYDLRIAPQLVYVLSFVLSATVEESDNGSYERSISNLICTQSPRLSS